MISYRFRRRAFLTAVSGGVGLKIMLRNLESAARGTPSPARLLVTHWPIGIVAGSSDALFKATAGSVGGSPGLKPFADAGLGPDMTVIRGLTTANLTAMGGGGHGVGTVLLVTGRGTVGVRANPIQPDDAIAAPGGSIDQVLLQNVPALQRPLGCANSIADSRTDVGEIATKTLSYSTREQDVDLYAGAGTVRGSTPLLPVLSPLQQYMALFSGMAPGTPGTGGGGGGTGGGTPPRVADATLKKLVARRSVLDFSIEELNQLKRLGPADARSKLTNHTDAVLAAEQSVVSTINAGYPSTGGSGGSSASGTGGAAGSGGGTTCTCATKPPAPPALMGQPDWTSGQHGNYGTPSVGATDEAAAHAQVGKAHLDVLKAAFICDLIRVGTFQWAPGDSHVGFAMRPGDTIPYQHHPMSHMIGGPDTTASATVAGLNPIAQFMFNVQSWYFARHAENLASWKNAVDACGNNLLDFTCVPFLTEVRTLSHERTNMPAMIIGGKQLGFRHDRYVTDPITINQLWGTIAQAYGHTSTDAPFAPPVSGFWAKP